MTPINTRLINELQERGLISQSTHPEALQQVLSAPATVYCGFDPTADSLHIGHLVPLLMLKRFHQAGHRTIALIGGATGMIGDPSFKATERSLNSADTVGEWAGKLSDQITTLMNTGENDEVHQDSLTIVNNADWISGLSLIDFFRDVGKHFSVNAMVNRESVRQRLARPDQGISFTEFSYPLLQSYDFAYLNRQFGCTLQIGGNDQWGNIVSGIDLTRRLNGNQVCGMTLPLITKSDGTKFGKTEGGAIWLDAEKTSPYSFYQFWLNTDDADVYRFLNYYTFLSPAEIQAIEARDLTASGKPEAQAILAVHVTRFVHGEEGLISARRISDALFNGTPQSLALSELQQLEQDGLPCAELPRLPGLCDMLITGKLAGSKRQAREFISHGAIRVNGEKVQNEALDQFFPLYDRYWLVQRGKKQFCLFKLI